MAEKKHTAILLFGPPGVGKGTQGQILGNIPGYFHLSSGDVFRSLEIGSPEGKEVYRYISPGPPRSG
jgi:adenylate kinase